MNMNMKEAESEEQCEDKTYRRSKIDAFHVRVCITT